MNVPTQLRKRKISEFVAIVAMILLLIYISDAAVGQGKQGFLPMNAAQRGMIFGASSIILFFISFSLVGFKEKTKITTILLIVGGALIGTSVLGASVMARRGVGEEGGGLATISGSFIAVIILGYIIMGLGIVRAIKKK
ncbi:MAG TPA: hypothetical protein VJ729_02880 [Nitrososphaeraceae archaeon]|nr:hypothetical protein [Nitrososphaeraceae archaeon]